MIFSNEALFNQSLTDTRIKWEKESQFAFQALQKNSFLESTAKKNMGSLQNAIINIAAIGITLNPAEKLAYLVPREGMVCLDISYMGLLRLAQDSGSITWGQCKLVRQNDDYQNNGLDSAPSHKYNAFGDRGAVVGGYCTVKLPNGDYITEEMSIEDIITIRDRSVAYKAWKKDNKKTCPWVDFFDEMARKSIVKRASKYWPKTDRLDNATHYLNTVGQEGLEEVEVKCSEYQRQQIIEKTERLSIDCSGIIRVSKVKDLTDVPHSIAERYITRLNEWLGIKEEIEAMREAYEAEDYPYFYQIYSELSELDKDSLNVAPTKGGVFTTKQREMIREMASKEALAIRNKNG